MDNGENNDDIGGETWGADLFNDRDRTYTACSSYTDASEGLDFSPARLEMIKERASVGAAPLPKGVKDVQWQAPEMSGLGHSLPIFATETDRHGTFKISSDGFTSNNCHFRSWQEDNGTAKAFASETVEKEVDGHRRTVAIGYGRQKSRPTSADANQASTVEAGPLLTRKDIDCLTKLRRSLSTGDEIRFDGPVLEARDAAGPLLPSTDASIRKEMPSPRSLPEAAASDEERQNCAYEKISGESLSMEGGAASPPFSSTDAVNHVPSMPQRPKYGATSSRTQQPRPGRSLFSQGAVDGVNASTWRPRQEEGAEVVRQPPPSTEAGGEACGPAALVSDPGVGHLSSGTTGPTAQGGIGGEETRAAGGQDSQQRHAGDGEGNHEGSKEPNPKVEGREKNRWWGGLRTPRAPTPQPTQLPAVSLAAGSHAAPAEPRWRLGFRRRRQKAKGA